MNFDVVLPQVLDQMLPFAGAIREFVSNGGMASLAIGWFSDEVGGDRVDADVIARLAEMGMTLDIYVYLTPSLDDGDARANVELS